MMERIDSEESARLGARWMAALSERFRLSRPALVALQAVALLLVVGALGWIWSVGQEPSFRTLSDPAESTTASQPRLRVVFDDRVSVAEMREILDEIGGHVVGGPSSHGVYTVAIEPASGEAVEVSAVIDRLRTHEGVRFAEPVGEGSSELQP
jgi:hypothetical protein